MTVNKEADLFARLGGVIDEARDAGVSWAKIHGVVATLLEVTKYGLRNDLDMSQEFKDAPNDQTK